jgi:uncharacterized protein (TIGR02284 family)
VTERPPESKADSVDSVASTLNQLVQTCKDGEHGFLTAAQAVEDPNLRRLFESYSQQRAEFAAELQVEVERGAEEPEGEGHAVAALHRGWMNLKSVVTGKGEGAIIAECERGEDFAVQAYERALRAPLSADLKGMVERQFLKIKEAHDQVRSLEQVHSRHS